MSLRLLFAFFFLPVFLLQGQQQLIVDADTGNEMDDLYAITRIVLSENFDVLALNSAHFNNPQLLTDSMWHIYPTRNISTVDISQALNEELLDVLGRTDIPHPRGADKMLGYAWGYYEGATVPRAEAIDLLIKKLETVPEGERLIVACLGAVTNVASALELRPDLAGRLRLYFLGMSYNVRESIWNKNEFNARNDLNGLDQLLSNPEIEFYIMPISVARPYRFDKGETIEQLKASGHPVAPILIRRWEEVSAGDSWIMWDLALIEAILRPELATISKRPVPPENGTHLINVYISIDEPAMKKDFWTCLE